VGINSGIYKLVLVLHILCAIVGFGAVLLNGIYGQQARSRRGTEGLAITQANFLVSRIAQYFIYAVFVFGILLVVLSDKAWSFSDSWIVTAMVLYILGIGLSHGLRKSWSRWARRRPGRPAASRLHRSSSSKNAAGVSAWSAPCSSWTSS